MSKREIAAVELGDWVGKAGEKVIDPELIHGSLTQVQQHLWPSRVSKTGRRIVRVERIRETIVGRENDPILLDDFAKYFEGTKNPRKEAGNAIGVLNAAYRQLGINLQLVGINVSYSGTKFTFYKFVQFDMVEFPK